MSCSQLFGWAKADQKRWMKEAGSAAKQLVDGNWSAIKEIAEGLGSFSQMSGAEVRRIVEECAGPAPTTDEPSYERGALSQTEKARQFRALHQAPGVFVIANAWDAGSARILAGADFVALATSSGTAAGTLGRCDGMITREESLAHAQAVVEATEPPVPADLEKGFAYTLEDAAPTISVAAESGFVGGSIGDDFSDCVELVYSVHRYSAEYLRLPPKL